MPTVTGWRILDLGCGESGQAPWLSGVPDVVGVDLRAVDPIWKPYPNFIRGDARRLPFPSRAFDLVFSNSLIEHLPTWEDQKICAAEIRRVGHRYWVQVPNRHFPVDPHYIIPFFQYLPYRVQKTVAKHISLGWNKKGTYQFKRVNCLTRRQMRELFPQARIITESVAGLTKSFIAIGEVNSPNAMAQAGITPPEAGPRRPHSVRRLIA